MSDKIQITSLKPITEIKKVYSGHPGCACGCQGTYWEDARNIKRINNIFLRNLNSVYSWESHKNQFVCFDQDENRHFTIHYKE